MWSSQPAWGRRSSSVPDPSFLSVTMLNQIEDYLRDFSTSQRRVQFGINALVQILARANQGFAQTMARGPVDPRQQNPRAAWKLPVRRISGVYYRAWRVRRLRPGVWQVFNDSREAYYIEFGIHPSGNRVRRPIRKMSLLKTLRWADNSRVGHRVWEEIYGPLRGRPYNQRGQGIMLKGVQSPGVNPRVGDWM